MVVRALLLISIIGAISHGTPFQSTANMWKSMYKELRHKGGCYLLLNSTGQVGCTGADNGRHTRAPLADLKHLKLPLEEPRVVVVDAQDAQAFILHMQQLFQQQQQQQQGPAAVSSNSLLEHVKAILVLQEDGMPPPANQSSALKFPGGQEWAPYATSQPRAQQGTGSSGADGLAGGDQPAGPAYVWNPAGSGSSLGFLPIPVFKLTGALASDARQRAGENARNGFAGASHWAEAELSMTAASQPNSSACIMAGTCKPLGGFNVWAAMPALPYNPENGLPSRSGKPVTLITAQMDASGFFHDDIQAADSPLSGLLAMLMSMHILKGAGASSMYTRQLVFVGLAGEPWGYMGSRRLLWDMHRANADPGAAPDPYVAGLHLDDVDQVIELGSIGRAFDASSQSTKLFAHSQPPTGWGNASSLIDELQSASHTTPSKIDIHKASSSNPGIPPSSLFSFLRAKPSIAGVLLAEFDRQFINPYYFGGPYDNASAVSISSLAATAASLATALHSIASKAADPPPPPLKVNLTEVIRFGASLAECLTTDAPGMSCALAQRYLNPDFQVLGDEVSYAVNHYVGVLSYIHSNPQNPYYKKTIYRFLWNLMGHLTSMDSDSRGTQRLPCAFASHPCPAGMECIGWKGGRGSDPQLGQCLRTTVRYSLSMPTSLDYIPNDQGSAGFKFTNASLEWSKALAWPEDPVWAESDWIFTTPYVLIAQREPQTMETYVVTAGVLLVTTITLCSWYGREERHATHDFFRRISR
mmetsp:Transcript_423/g.1083  ORF Transcript_423/g.1083 Transcript_423/m.1083 type:complete len:756 (+) Transcript_423:101-2368(+)